MTRILSDEQGLPILCLCCICPHQCYVRIELNGKVLPNEVLRLHDRIYRRHKLGGVGPYGYIYEYRLNSELFPVLGANRLRVTLIKDDPNINALIDVYDVDCVIKYRVHRDFDANITEA